jgi:hypothetical protein
MCERLSIGRSLDEPETVDEAIEAAKRPPSPPDLRVV